MFAAVPLFMAEMSDRLELLAMKCLTVLGGFLAGYVAGRLGGWAFDRWVYKGTTPEGLKKTAGTVLGLVVALIVALLIFTFGEGGGSGGGSGAGAGSGKAAEQPAGTPVKEPDKPPAKVDPVEVKPSGADDPVVRVTFLGGDAVRADRYYLIDDGKDPKTLDEAKAEITARKKKAEPKSLVLYELYPADQRLAPPPDNPSVSQLRDWANRDLGITVIRPGRK